MFSKCVCVRPCVCVCVMYSQIMHNPYLHVGQVTMLVIYIEGEEETKAEPDPNLTLELLFAFPKVECSGQHTRRVP